MLVTEKLVSCGWLPDLIMSSNSLRTRQTLQAMSAAVAAFGAAETHLLGSLYTVAALDGQTLKHLQARYHELVCLRRPCPLCTACALAGELLHGSTLPSWRCARAGC